MVINPVWTLFDQNGDLRADVQREKQEKKKGGKVETNKVTGGSATALHFLIQGS
jgi:hypothetical protein